MGTIPLPKVQRSLFKAENMLPNNYQNIIIPENAVIICSSDALKVLMIVDKIEINRYFSIPHVRFTSYVCARPCVFIDLMYSVDNTVAAASS